MLVLIFIPQYNNQYNFGQRDMTCLRSSERTLKPSQTNSPDANNLMPCEIIPRFGIGATKKVYLRYRYIVYTQFRYVVTVITGLQYHILLYVPV